MGSLNEKIARRDALALLVGAPFAAKLLSCAGEEPVHRIEGELLGPDMSLGHRVREADVDPSPSRVRRTKTLIIGGGAAGLSAGWRLLRRGETEFMLVELDGALGGTARDGQSGVTRYPWGAHYLPAPSSANADLCDLLSEMGAWEDGKPAEHVRVREPDERVFFEGYWYPGLYPYAGASEEDRAQLQRFDDAMQTHSETGAFQIPVAHSRFTPELAALDRMNAAEWMARHRFDSPRLLWLCDYATRDDYGLRLADTSAWAHVFYWASRSGDDETGALMTWPEGNGALVRHLGRAVGERARLGWLALNVEEQRDRVRVHLVSAAGEREVVEADRVIAAVPRFVAAHIAPDLDLSKDGFESGAWMVANLHLDRRPSGRGSQPCWDNVIHDSPALGYVSATHQRGREFGPTVWTYYLPMLERDPRQSRRALLAAGHASLSDLVMRDLERAHPDLRSHLNTMDIWRWGHAMVRPRVGFLGGGTRERASRARGRVHFAHSDLSGIAIFEEAFFHGVRAADEVLAA